MYSRCVRPLPSAKGVNRIELAQILRGAASELVPTEFCQVALPHEFRVKPVQTGDDLFTEGERSRREIPTVRNSPAQE